MSIAHCRAVGGTVGGRPHRTTGRGRTSNGLRRESLENMRRPTTAGRNSGATAEAETDRSITEFTAGHRHGRFAPNAPIAPDA